MNNDDLNSLIEISQENESAFPEAVRKKYDLAVGDIIEWIPQDSGAFTIKKVYSDKEMDRLIANMPTEVIDVDKNGNYDPKEHHDFYKWMEFGE